MKGPDLTEMFLSELRDIEIGVEPIESRSGKVVYARIADRARVICDTLICRIRDILGDSVTKKSILICGDGKVEVIFVMDFRYLSSLLREGKVVRKKRAVYEEYQATIFPERGYQIIVTGTHGLSIDARKFMVPLSGVLQAIIA